MQNKPTDELNELLEKTSPKEVGDYLKNNNDYLATDEKTFYYYMKNTIEEKHIKLKDVYSFAGVSESYGSQILRMEKHTKNRDLILKLCICAHFKWDETDKALKLYGFNELYSKNPRDAVIIVALNNRIYDLGRIDEMLSEQDLETLSTAID